MAILRPDRELLRAHGFARFWATGGCGAAYGDPFVGIDVRLQGECVVQPDLELSELGQRDRFIDELGAQPQPEQELGAEKASAFHALQQIFLFADGAFAGFRLGLGFAALCPGAFARWKS